jgi:hypothetical protein
MRDAVVLRGFAVARAPSSVLRLGRFYTALRDEGTPWVVTLDALFFLTHLALDRAFADVDANAVVPALAALLRRLDVRLGEGARGARPDTEGAYRIARSLVCVARALGEPGYLPPPELQSLVGEEQAAVIAHAGPAESPALGVLVDYSTMALRGFADAALGSAGWFRALAWVEAGGLALAGLGEPGVGAQVNIASTRTHARAAVLLTRLLDFRVDAEAAAAWDRLERVREIETGEPDDVSPRELSAAAAGLGIDLGGLNGSGDVVLIDRVRRAAAREHAARLYDGWGAASVPASGGALLPGLVAPSFRLLAAGRTADTELLQGLVYPFVGALTRPAPPFTARDGVRSLPAALDIAAWLGSGEARAALHEAGDDAYEGYREALARAVAARAADDAAERHRSLYASMLDAIEGWLAPSVGDQAVPAASTTEWRKRKAEVALGAWTALRRDIVPLTRVVVPEVRLPHVASGTTVPAFVEPHPEAIAKLVSVVRQASRWLTAEGLLPAGAPALVVLGEVADLLGTALAIAAHEAEGERIPSALADALATLPARLTALEDALVDSGAVDVSLAADVHTDEQSGRALEEALGPIEEAWLVLREPGGEKDWLAVGASIPHYEFAVPAAGRMTDSVWRTRLLTGRTPLPSVVERAYRVAPEPADGKAQGR